jgi:hypothetical protein
VAGIRRAALASAGGRRVLLVEPLAGAARDLAAVRERLAWAALDRVAAVDAIPVDARHNAKVDYAALEEMVRRRGLR